MIGTNNKNMKRYALLFFIVTYIVLISTHIFYLPHYLPDNSTAWSTQDIKTKNVLSNKDHRGIPKPHRVFRSILIQKQKGLGSDIKFISLHYFFVCNISRLPNVSMTILPAKGYFQIVDPVLFYCNFRI